MSSIKDMPLGTLASAVTADARPRWLVIAPMLSFAGNPALAHRIGMIVMFISAVPTRRVTVR